MKTNLLLLAFLALSALAADSPSPAVHAPRVPGRYQIIPTTQNWPGSRTPTRDVEMRLNILLDTATGESWILAPTPGVDNPVAWFKLSHFTPTNESYYSHFPEVIRDYQRPPATNSSARLP